MDTTVAGCQVDGLETLITVVPLLPPRVTVRVVPIHFPEPWLVVFHEAEPAHPFSRLPEVEVRYQEARRSTVLGRERFTVVLPGNDRLPVQQILDRKVGCIAAVAERHHEWRRGLLEPGRFEDPIDGDTPPVGIELRPSGHAMNVHRDVRRPERTELVPVP